MKHDRIKKIFAEAAKFGSYNIQTQTMEVLEQGSSVIVSAPASSGKSEAIIIPSKALRFMMFNENSVGELYQKQ